MFCLLGQFKLAKEKNKNLYIFPNTFVYTSYLLEEWEWEITSSELLLSFPSEYYDAYTNDSSLQTLL